jgi:hypothetical protein
MGSVLRRLRALWRRDRLDDELAEEIGTHIELRRHELIAGLGIALAAVRVLGSIFYGVSPFDPLAFTAATGILAAAAAVGATWLPARRAAAVDPILALRSE